MAADARSSSSELALHPSWTSNAAEVVQRACERYGGVAAWREIRRIRLIPKRLSGLVPWLKGLGRTFHVPEAFDVFPHARMARFIGYPEADYVGVFDAGSVRIERCDGKVVQASIAHRATFRGAAKYRRWRPMDALYFFGYALTHYHTLPFSLWDARLIGIRTAGTASEGLDVLAVELPPELPTHSRKQRFYFDRAGNLVRHDYHAEILGFWARGAHYWSHPEPHSGFPIALDRLVRARFGPAALPVTALHATFVRAEVERG